MINTSLLIDKHGTKLFVEVEWDTDKNIEQRQEKWRNFYQVSGWKMFFVYDYRACMRNIRNKINYYLGCKSSTVLLTNLVELQAGKCGEGDSIWVDVKHKGN